jgi:signal transduction histidine kinase
VYKRTRLQLTIWYATVFLGVLVVLGLGTYFGMVWALDREVDASIRAVANDWIGSAPSADSLQPLDVEAHSEGAPSDVFLVVFRADGALIANPRAVEVEEFVEHGMVRDALSGRSVWSTLSSEGAQLRVWATPVRREGELTGAVVAGRNLAGRNESIRIIVAVLGVVAGGGLLLALAAGYVLAGRALAPLRLAYDRQQQFIGDASHELRSPLTLIRALAELLQRGQLEPDQRATAGELVTVADEANALVDDLLSLARISEDETADPSASTDLGRVAASGYEQLRPLLDRHGCRVELQLDTAAAAISEREALRIVRALLENVLAHTPRGSRVRLTTGLRARYAVLTVEDDGPGVSEADLAHIFDRFTQLNAARTPGEGAGAGLGLAIVAASAARHQGQVRGMRSMLGGLKVEVMLPRREPPW